MTEITPGSGVYWYESNKACVTAVGTSGTKLTSACVDVFFTREVLKVSNLKGGGVMYNKLDPKIVSAIQCKLRTFKQ